MTELESARDVKAPFRSYFALKLERKKITIFAHCSYSMLQITSQQFLYIKALAAAQSDAKLFIHNVVTTLLADTHSYQLQLCV